MMVKTYKRGAHREGCKCTLAASDLIAGSVYSVLPDFKDASVLFAQCMIGFHAWRGCFGAVCSVDFRVACVRTGDPVACVHTGEHLVR